MIERLSSFFIPLTFLSFSLLSCSTKEKSITLIEEKKDSVLVLENDLVQLKISAFGGAFIDFHEKKSGLNPLSWKLSESQMPENNRNGAVFQGHFLCLGRWGSPSVGEKKLGMPHNGEPACNWWTVKNKKEVTFIEMSCEAPLDGLNINRKVNLSQSDGCFKVTETITNDLTIERVNAVMQHVTLGEPFLDKSLTVHSNATQGFNQQLFKAGNEKYASSWPKVFTDTLMRISDVSKGTMDTDFVASFIFADSIGWITATNMNQRQMIGYVWKTADYPWLHIWNGVRDGKPWAKGLEFGTTGLGDAFTLSERCSINFHGIKNVEFIDAKSSLTKSYYSFNLTIPEGFQKTLNVFIENEQIKLVLLTNTGIKEFLYSL